MSEPIVSVENKKKCMKWIDLGYTNEQIRQMAVSEGWDVSRNQLLRYRKTETDPVKLAARVEMKENKPDWFSREYRAQKAAEILDVLQGYILDGSLWTEEVTENKTKKVYNGAIVKNWNDTVKTIADELGQRKEQKEVTHKIDESLSALIGKIYNQDNEVQGEFTEGEIVALPPAENNFSSDEEYAEIAKKQSEEKGIPDMDEEIEDELF